MICKYKLSSCEIHEIYIQCLPIPRISAPEPAWPPSQNRLHTYMYPQYSAERDGLVNKKHFSY